MAQTDFMSAIRQIAVERKIEINEIVDAIKEALISSFVSAYGIDDPTRFIAEIDPEKGDIAVYALKEVVAGVTANSMQISLEDAKKLTDKKVKGGDLLKMDITAQGDFGRIAAQAARQVIMQKLGEAEKNAIIKQFSDKVGTIISVFVQRVTREGDVICEVGKAKGVISKDDRIVNEFYRSGSTLKVLLKSIEDDGKGKVMMLSRSAPEFLKALFRVEVPEIESESVEIVSVAREAGSRSKVAVRSIVEGVDPIGACVGQKGVRINAISNELKFGNIEEKVDIILWDEDIETFIMNSIRPAEALKVELVDKANQKAMIVVADAQQSLAIGKEGQNVRLSSKLTGWTLDIKSETEYKELKQETAPKKKKSKKSEETAAQ